MKITRENLKAWFPPDRRFLHFCAKYYHLSFYSNDVVEEANFIAIKNVMTLYNREQEFESEQHMFGTVMSAFRFAILNSYQSRGGANRRNLKLRYNAELTYTNGDSDDYSAYEARCVSYDKPYDVVHEKLNEFIDTQLPIIEREVVRRHIMNDEDAKVLAEDLDITTNNIRSAKARAFRKIRNFRNSLDETINTAPKPTYNDKYISPALSQLRRKMADESNAEKPIKTCSYSEAMSFLYPEAEV
jgi:RNA polymerase sigma factor (sigma-70 family)